MFKLPEINNILFQSQGVTVYTFTALKSSNSMTILVTIEVSKLYIASLKRRAREQNEMLLPNHLSVCIGEKGKL